MSTAEPADVDAPAPRRLHVIPTVAAVTVYTNRAQVRREASMSLDASSETAIVFPMPNTFDRDSAQVHFSEEASRHVVLRGVIFEEEEEKEEEEQGSAEGGIAAKRDALQAQLREWVAKTTDVVNRESAVETKWNLAQEGFQLACSSMTCGVEAALQPPTWKRMIDDHRDQLTALRAERRQLQKEHKAADEQVRLLQDQIRELGTGRPRHLRRKVSAVVIVSVRSPVPDAVMSVSYMVNTSSWNAVYEVGLNSVTKVVTVTYSAEVMQRSEEDWNNVELTLSTAAPRAHRAVPKLTPWRLSEYQPVPPPMPKPMMMMNACKMMARCADVAAAEGAPDMAMAADEMEEAEAFGACLQTASSVSVEAATASESAVMSTFVLPKRYTVKCGGAKVRVPLAVIELSADISYTVVPSELEVAFAYATCTNDSEFMLLDGAASVFMDGDFVLTSQMPRTPPGEKLELSFGPDSTVEVKRVQVRRLVTKQKASILTRDPRQCIRHEYRTTLTNRKPSGDAVKLTVRERIPKSDDARLVVRLVEPEEVETPEQQRELNIAGIVERVVEVAPGGSTPLLLTFEVTAPADETICGGV